MAGWRPVERWYRTFIMWVGSWVFFLVGLTMGTWTFILFPILMSFVMWIYQPPRDWREHLPRLGRFKDDVDRVVLRRRTPSPRVRR